MTPPDVVEERVSAGGDTINVASAGEGPALLLLHGWPETWWRWRHVIPGLARDRRVIAVDLPGFGASTNRGGDYSTRALAEVVLRVVDAIGVERFALAGHDWGGSVAYVVAAIARDRVDALVAEEELLPGFRVEPDGLAGGTYPTWHGGFHRLPGLPELLVRGHEREYYGYFWDLAARPDAIDAQTREVYLSAYRSETALAGGLALYRAAEQDAAYHRALAKVPLDVPVLAIGGDRAIGSGVEASFAHVARSVEGRVIAECGHYPAEEHPAEWLRLVRAFLG
ncbi:MAG TPA: alpha/beta hydrolase [Actinomycetota bacterium]|nr:alpha/beta hydrolase [Actinomycetota bacterium]